jgi:hypothetical protein
MFECRLVDDALGSSATQISGGDGRYYFKRIAFLLSFKHSILFVAIIMLTIRSYKILLGND